VNQQKLFRWRPTRRQLLWVGVIAALALLIIVICGYFFGWPWTGLTSSKAPPNTQPTKTLWDWLDLLIVPLVLAIGGYLFNSSQNRATEAAAERRAQDEALQAYLDHMSGLLIASKDQPSLYDEHPPDSLGSVVRSRTLTVLNRLDGSRKGSVVQFLFEARLIRRDPPIIDLLGANLAGACLVEADLSGVYLRSVDLRGAVLTSSERYYTNLIGATLSEADMSDADLRGVDLSSAHLGYAVLRSADLRGTRLDNAYLSHANLTGADLSGANLSSVDLSWANLRGTTGVTEERLEQQASSLEGATMPAGSKHPQLRSLALLRNSAIQHPFLPGYALRAALKRFTTCWRQRDGWARSPPAAEQAPRGTERCRSDYGDGREVSRLVPW
jgi:hypothetical protein